jgi:hypothetical protein
LIEVRSFSVADANFWKSPARLVILTKDTSQTNKPTHPTTGHFDFRICQKKGNFCRFARINVKFMNKCSIVINERIVDLFVPALFLKYTIPFLAMGFKC